MNVDAARFVKSSKSFVPSALKILFQLLEDWRVRIYPLCRPNEKTHPLKVSQVSLRNLCDTDLFQNTVHCLWTADVKADEHRVWVRIG